MFNSSYLFAFLALWFWERGTQRRGARTQAEGGSRGGGGSRGTLMGKRHKYTVIKARFYLKKYIHTTV